MAEAALLGAEFDEPWKVALELFFEAFLLLCFPAVHSLIDWSQAPVFLDTELQQITGTRRRQKRTVDKLVRVRMRSGGEKHLFVHVEVQAQRDRQFAARMWTYYRRIVDKFGPHIISLAVLADDQPQWKPSGYSAALGGCEVRFTFPIFKVIEMADAGAEFERTQNPFALIVAAHQVALSTRRDGDRRYAERFRLVRTLYRHGLQRDTILHLLRLMRWLTKLPPGLEEQFDGALAQLEGRPAMVSTDHMMMPFELKALEKGRQEGREEGREEGRLKALPQAVVDVLQARFGKVPARVKKKVEQLATEDQLWQAHRLAAVVPSIEEFLEKV